METDIIIEFDFSIIPERLIGNFDDNRVNNSRMPHIPSIEIKSHNEIWRVHKNDVDKFPSDPHAHNIETNLKLDLGTGGLYKKTQFTGFIRKKDLNYIREFLTDKINKWNKKLPPLSYGDK